MTDNKILTKEILEKKMHEQHGLKGDAQTLIKIARFVIMIIRNNSNISETTMLKISSVIQILEQYEKAFENKND